ncbi:MAG: Rrf2 family transcriptional regulator [Eubacterium sp.]|nr:Rrf2 family transcriptional regulator [Eubacterium sp.]
MISTKGRYAVRVMIDLAEHVDDKNVPLKDIAERQMISKKYLEAIVKDLVSAKLIKGSSGKGGGYKLVKSPEEYFVGEILESTEGPLASVACIADEEFNCPRKTYCQTLPMWEEFDSMVHDYFYSKKLSDLIK